MARSNFSFKKRQKELERKKKQEEKRQRRMAKKETEEETPVEVDGEVTCLRRNRQPTRIQTRLPMNRLPPEQDTTPIRIAP